MEVAVEVEDDAFFADLSKQINLLIMDDDEDSVTHSPSVSLQAFSQAIQFQPAPQLPFLLHEQSCRRESKGTGVFIPCSSHQRRKGRQGRHNSSNAKYQKHLENSRGLPPQVPHRNYNEAFHNNSFNPRRF